MRLLYIMLLIKSLKMHFDAIQAGTNRNNLKVPLKNNGSKKFKFGLGQFIGAD